MQATQFAPSPPPTTPSHQLMRNMGWFLAAPITAVVVITILLAVTLNSYRQQHLDRIYTGVTLWGIDLSMMTRPEAEQALQAAFPYPHEASIVFTDAKTDREWVFSPADLGLTFDVNQTIDEAYEIGRQEHGLFGVLQDQFDTWYYGRQIAPVVVFDEAKLDQAINAVAADINHPPADASLDFTGTSVSYLPPEVGRSLDTADTRSRLIAPITNLREVRLQLLVHETQPQVHDTSQAAEQIEQILSGPLTLYLQEPLENVDLERIVIPQETLVEWIRIQQVTAESGQAETQVFLDQNAIRTWLEPYAATLRREPVNARFYFDDFTRELVLVEPHVNGRALDIDATVEAISQQALTTNRSMALIFKDVVPIVHAGATAEELGITELVSESTTWFYGSTDERKHNISRSASNFYGIVIAPGEEFSFNHYLGEVSEELGYETGLIIYGGRTIEGVGGGVCQVSTTLFQSAFWAGYPIVERWAHGYQVHYYDDGEGTGMDATVFSPLVDLRFINDTPYYLLIENYYNEANSSLTFKMYSTSLGREVVKDGPYIENVVPAKPDVWEFNDELEQGEIKQVDWAVEGADVTVGRTVYNASGDLLRQDTFVSHYIPWQNVYQYGPDTNIPGPVTDGSG
ncbi:MAG: VanW family protein [Candidatus Promineifilaceae bacterium]